MTYSQQTAVQRLIYRRYRDGVWERAPGAVIRETPVTIFVDQRELVTIACTPLRVNHLVLGFLWNEGVIESLGDVAMLRVCDEDATVDVRLANRAPVVWERRTLTTGCGGAYTGAGPIPDLVPIGSSPTAKPEQVLHLIKQLQGAATLFRECGGVHTSALADSERLLAVAEDVGRHNTVDKICGQCLLEGTPTAGRLLLTTGRLSSEVVVKAARMGVPILVSRNSPTGRAVDLAEALGITLVGYARGGSFTVYSHPTRVAGSER